MTSQQLRHLRCGDNNCSRQGQPLADAQLCIPCTPSTARSSNERVGGHWRSARATVSSTSEAHLTCPGGHVNDQHIKRSPRHFCHEALKCTHHHGTAPHCRCILLWTPSAPSLNICSRSQAASWWACTHHRAHVQADLHQEAHRHAAHSVALRRHHLAFCRAHCVSEG